MREGWAPCGGRCSSRRNGRWRWERESCQLLQMIRSPRTLAWGMHLSADGSRAWGVSEAHGQFCRFDFESGRVTLEGVERKRITGGPHFLGKDTAAVAFEEHLLRIVVNAQDPTGREFDGHTHQVLGLAASADGHRMFSACLDRTIGFRDIERGSLVRRVRGAQWGFTQVRCDHQGLMVIASEDQAARARTWDLSRPATYRSMGAAVAQAQLRLAQGANDAESLRAVGQWYEFRGNYEWAHALLSAAVEMGATVDPQVMARCNWMMGHRAATLEWLERALSVEAEPRRTTYLRIWRDSLDPIR